MRELRPPRLGEAVSEVSNLVVVEDLDGLRAMEEYLLSPERSEIVLGLSCRTDTQEPVLAPDRVRRILGREAWIYVVKDALLLGNRDGLLAPALSLKVDCTRIWRPGCSAESLPSEHPLIPRIPGEPEADALVDLSGQLLLTARDGRDLGDQLAQEPKPAAPPPGGARRQSGHEAGGVKKR